MINVILGQWGGKKTDILRLAHESCVCVCSLPTNPPPSTALPPQTISLFGGKQLESWATDRTWQLWCRLAETKAATIVTSREDVLWHPVIADERTTVETASSSPTQPLPLLPPSEALSSWRTSSIVCPPQKLPLIKWIAELSAYLSPAQPVTPRPQCEDDYYCLFILSLFFSMATNVE